MDAVVYRTDPDDKLSKWLTGVPEKKRLSDALTCSEDIHDLSKALTCPKDQHDLSDALTGESEKEKLSKALTCDIDSDSEDSEDPDSSDGGSGSDKYFDDSDVDSGSGKDSDGPKPRIKIPTPIRQTYTVNKATAEKAEKDAAEKDKIKKNIMKKAFAKKDSEGQWNFNYFSYNGTYNYFKEKLVKTYSFTKEESDEIINNLIKKAEREAKKAAADLKLLKQKEAERKAKKDRRKKDIMEKASVSTDERGHIIFKYEANTKKYDEFKRFLNDYFKFSEKESIEILKKLIKNVNTYLMMMIR